MKRLAVLFSAICLATQLGHADPALSEIQFKITSEKFEAGDTIVVEKVIASSPDMKTGDTVVVRGRYTLKSKPKASLGFFLTTKGPSGVTSVSPKQTQGITAGTGTFELEHLVPADGALHISFYPSPRGSSFGGVYFGPVQE